MRSRKAANEHVAEVARRRLELLTAELADAQGRASTPARPGEPLSDEPGSAPAAGPSVEPPRAAGGRHVRRPVPAPARIVGWVHDRLPPTLQGRVQLGSSHLTVVALLVAAALAVTAWWVIRADGGTVVPTAAGASTGASPALPLAAASGAADPVAGADDESTTESATDPTAGRPSSSGRPVVVVDVAGKVRRPGIATLPVGARVVDALEAAGGARRGVDVTVLNLARVLVDGEQIVVGVPPPAGVAAPAASAPGAAGEGSPGPLVNLNTATQTELETLPGVGPVTATAILQWRTDNGAFSSVDELLEVSGIGDATLSELAPFVTL
ncbi:MAG TPA: helix-hairpin-helix domain-containing protein [Nocardioidaceae bacterium]|nr:helix-hairpin-helix domain-containing protein [Nocardioidaceae bacterium]